MHYHTRGCALTEHARNPTSPGLSSLQGILDKSCRSVKAIQQNACPLNPGELHIIPRELTKGSLRYLGCKVVLQSRVPQGKWGTHLRSSGCGANRAGKKIRKHVTTMWLENYLETPVRNYHCEGHKPLSLLLLLRLPGERQQPAATAAASGRVVTSRHAQNSLTQLSGKADLRLCVLMDSLRQGSSSGCCPYTS